MSNLRHRAGTPYPRAIAVAARTMSTTSTAWTKLIRTKRLAEREQMNGGQQPSDRHRQYE